MSDIYQDSHSTPLALPSPQDDAIQLPVDGAEHTFKFDSLGPIVVNSDGTLSRISNWPEMTAFERERAVRILVKRNQIRLADQEKQPDVSNTDGKLSILSSGEVDSDVNPSSH